MPEIASAVEREIRIDASAETVFAYLIEPDKMPLWMGSSAELDPRPGGIYRVTINPKVVASGEFVEVEPPRRVLFTWGWEGDENPTKPGSSTVEITLEADGEATLVRVVHRDLGEEQRAPHDHGWGLYLDRLAIIATGGEAGPDPNA